MLRHLLLKSLLFYVWCKSDFRGPLFIADLTVTVFMPSLIVLNCEPNRGD